MFKWEIILYNINLSFCKWRRLFVSIWINCKSRQVPFLNQLNPDKMKCNQDFHTPVTSFTQKSGLGHFLKLFLEITGSFYQYADHLHLSLLALKCSTPVSHFNMRICFIACERFLIISILKNMSCRRYKHIVFLIFCISPFLRLLIINTVQKWTKLQNSKCYLEIQALKVLGQKIFSRARSPHLKGSLGPEVQGLLHSTFLRDNLVVRRDLNQRL